ncbi:MAG: hypothetical protein LQ338_004123 [Usnochroma carphineum]|nr:MAG: hypothetical protein LQ338_004123 [Usnochroma carphineum]
MSEKSRPKSTGLVSREKRPSPLGSTLFVGLRAADAVLQYNLLSRGWAQVAIQCLGGAALPTAGTGPLGLTPYGAVMTSLALGASFKHVVWKAAIGEQEIRPAAAIIIGLLHSVGNSANTLLSAWAWSSAAPTYLPPSASIADVLLSSPSVLVGTALFTAGIVTELYSEFQRKWFKGRPENKGKPYGGGFWSLATNINYGGYTLWRTGYAMAAAGPLWGLLIGALCFYEFTNRAIPELDQYCTDKPQSHNLHTKPKLLHSRSKPTPPPRPPDQDDYYSLLLAQPLASASPTTFSPPSSPHPCPPKKAKEPSRDPTIIFGTPLAGPSAARRRAGYGAEPYATNRLERPREPDNCCMSGCVNCVWDAYREEVEAWAARRREAARQAQHAQGQGEEEEVERRKASEMRGRGRRMVGGDTRRGEGSAGTGGVGDVDEPVRRGVDLDDEGALFAGVPVGIREFMATEKRLKERREGKEEWEKQMG